MTFAALDSSKTAAIRRRYGGLLHPRTDQWVWRHRIVRRMTEPEDNWLRRYGATTPIRILAKQLNRDRKMIERSLKRLGIEPVRERADKRRKA